MEKKFSGQIFLFLCLWRQHPLLHKTKGPTRNPISPTPPPSFGGRPYHPPPPHAEQFSGCPVARWWGPGGGGQGGDGACSLRMVVVTVVCLVLRACWGGLGSLTLSPPRGSGPGLATSKSQAHAAKPPPQLQGTGAAAARVLLKGGGAMGWGGGGPGTQKSKSLCTKNSQINTSFCKKFSFFPTMKSGSRGRGGVRPPPTHPTLGDAELSSKTLAAARGAPGEDLHSVTAIGPAIPAGSSILWLGTRLRQLEGSQGVQSASLP